MPAKKTLTLLFFLLINCLIQSCCSYDFCVKISNLSVSNYSVKSFAKIPSMGNFSAEEYALNIDFERDKRICQNTRLTNASLMATSCDDDQFFMENKVIQITIKSNSDLSENYPAGSELKTLFKIRYINYSYKSTNGTPSLLLGAYLGQDNTEAIEQIFNNQVVEGEEYVIDQFSNPYYHDIIFNLEVEEEIIPNDHTFTIGFLFMDKTFVELTSEEVSLIQ